jgi:hypothetical protein
MLSASQWTASNLTVGCLGKVGPIGNPGPQISGPQGPSGPSGFNGDGGPQGSQGPVGDTGRGGPSGPAGSEFFRIIKMSLTSLPTNYTFNSNSTYNILIITSSATDGSSKLILPQLVQPWNIIKYYTTGDVIVYGGVLYSSFGNSTGQVPTNNISYWTPSIWVVRGYSRAGEVTLYDGLWYTFIGGYSDLPPPSDPTKWIVSPTQYSVVEDGSWMMLKNCSEKPVTLVLSPSQTHTLPAPIATSSPLWYVYSNGVSFYVY